MEYQNIDEVARREACEKVKQIVKAIKAIKMKYYLNFSKISEEDMQRYQKLEKNLDKISIENNLTKMKAALMADISNRYDSLQNDNESSGGNNKPGRDFQKACIGAVEMEMKALNQGRYDIAIKCRERYKEYMKMIGTAACNDIIKIRRKKIGELSIPREIIEKKKDEIIKTLKFSVKKEYAQDRVDFDAECERTRANKIGIFEKVENLKGIKGIVTAVNIDNKTSKDDREIG